MAILGTLNDIKQGMVLIYNGEPHKVLIAKFVRMQMRKPVMQTKMRSLNTGKVVEYNFKPGDRLETGDLVTKKVNFLYAAGNEYVFMDNVHYDQLTFAKDKLGDQIHFLREGCEVNVIFFNDDPINIELPTKMEFKITASPDSVAGNSAQGRVTKNAEIETGYEVAVPLFVKTGDMIRVNTETGEYVERVN